MDRKNEKSYRLLVSTIAILLIALLICKEGRDMPGRRNTFTVWKKSKMQPGIDPSIV